MSDYPNCGDPLRADGNRPVMSRVSTGFGLANEEVTWFCSVWCREASNGVPPAYRCLRQTKLDQFGDDDRDGSGGITSVASSASAASEGSA